MESRNRRHRLNERRRTYESEPELESDGESYLSSEESYHPMIPMDAHIHRSDLVMVEAQAQQLKNKHNQIEITVESPISNQNAESQKVDLYRAALRGDWKAAAKCMGSNENLARIELTKRGDRALHIAAAAKQTAFVHRLVLRLNEDDLVLVNKFGQTAFYIAVQSGVVENAKAMYRKNGNLPTIRDIMRRTPLEMAVLFGNREMVEYLYRITRLQVLNAKEIMEILAGIIRIDMYDIALQILNKADRRIFTSTTDIGSVLQVLTRKPLSHNHGIQGRKWERLVSIIATIPYIPCKTIPSSLSFKS
ncbi:ankyrin repeat-containing At5g02620-like [Olea europaea subsp. europaea]|uniref:Ankyrin repeat-containing At5g02620-like n=1 Tax=Olea europaea subsp. europaea TaxID=158383 RepID=A0A8S0U1C5_OLEEU|nr:ankyrin repeat-containing At5g02620-like [Olea europaea subsp. europaea]